MDGQTRVLPDQHQAEGVLRALGDTLPEADLSRLRAFLAGESLLDIGDADARRIVDALKTAADRHWRIDPHRSLELAEAIIAIGEARDDTWIRALGTMAKGDAVKIVGSRQAAWDLLEEAARMFASVGDEVGWARTWIGRLYVAVQLNRLSEAVSQADRAREIFDRHGDLVRQMRLDWALGEMHWLTENPLAAEASYKRALAAEPVLGEHAMRGIYHNLGLIALHQGDPQRSLGYFERAGRLAHAGGEETDEAICQANVATARLQLGHFRQALALFDEVRPRYKQFFDSDAQIAFEMAECQESLDRHEEAAALFRQARQQWLSKGSKLEAARTALFQAMSEASLGDYAGARALLDIAEAEFVGLGAAGLSALVRLRRGQLALREGNPIQALELAQTCESHFRQSAQIHRLAETLLLSGGARFERGELELASRELRQALECAHASESPTLIYAAHLSLGRLAERQGRELRALRRYAVAEATLERLQRNLTVTLRPAFLSNRLDAQHARIGLHLKRGQIDSAFETVERMRAQIALGYLTGRESLVWSADDSISKSLAVELDCLRGEHHALTLRAQGETERSTSPSDIATARAGLVALERQMTSITERIRFRRPADSSVDSGAPSIQQLQNSLARDEAMLAYYDDGRRMHAFLIDTNGIHHEMLKADSAEIRLAQDQLERNLLRAQTAGNRAAVALTGSARAILARLGEMLLESLASRWHGKARLWVVPYGSLHALPFNLLRSNGRYLIETREVVTLPSASLLLRRPPQRDLGALVLAHDNHGRLPDVEREARIVHEHFAGITQIGAAATRDALRVPPVQLLHVAAHGSHRTDNPDFSHIALSDGQLLTDDVLRLDLSYELVTLSACETGRGRVSAADETLGVGWAFLYAGAGAVISSLWRISDARTVPLMERLYAALGEGLPKSSALRRAQIEALAEDPDAHPAFWGAFQLFGSPAALSRAGVKTSGAQSPLT